jgi:hypothetical protein
MLLAGIEANPDGERYPVIKPELPPSGMTNGWVFALGRAAALF